MKKNLLLLFLSLISICINAQKNFESLLQDGKVWKVEYSSTPVDHRGRSFLTARLTGICYGVIQKVRKNEL